MDKAKDGEERPVSQVGRFPLHSCGLDLEVGFKEDNASPLSEISEAAVLLRAGAL